MAITNTIVFVQPEASTTIHAMSADLQTELFTGTAQSTTNYRMEYDPTTEKLWIKDGTNRVSRYAVTDSAVTFEATITYANSHYGTEGCFDSVGNYYSVSYINGATSPVIEKILVAGTTPAGSITIAPANNSGTRLSAYGTSLVYDSRNDQIIAVYNGVVYTGTFSGSAPLYSKIPTDLSGTTKFGNFWEFSQNQNINHYGYLGNTYNSANDATYKTCEYNPVTGKVFKIFDYEASTYKSHLMEYDLNDYRWTNKKQIFQYKGTDATWEYSWGQLRIGKISGEIFIMHNNTEMEIVRLSPDGRYLGHCAYPAHTAAYWKTAFNYIKDEFYICDETTDVVFRLDKYGTIKNTSAVFVTGNPNRMIVANATNETTSVNVDPSQILFPTNQTTITDETPTIAFKVNGNPTGWTQQFRVVADTDPAVINGNPGDVYDRTFDSWLNGTSYVDATWSYSTDYDGVSDPDVQGTWVALGTGDGLQSGGTNITNGIDSNVAQYYVKMTVPVGSALTGAASNTTWYFNVFSYSKFV